MRSFEQLTTETETTSWIPADAYADLILEASVAYGDLSGVITAINHDMQACEGKIIQVRSVPARTAQALTGVGITDCLSSTSTTPTTYSITVGKYGDYDTMPGFSLFCLFPFSLSFSIASESSLKLARMSRHIVEHHRLQVSQSARRVPKSVAVAYG